jgi:hypothetical protein
MILSFISEGLSGAMFAAITALCSYVSVITPVKLRAFRMAIIEVTANLGEKYFKSIQPFQNTIYSSHSNTRSNHILSNKHSIFCVLKCIFRQKVITHSHLL